MSDTLITVATFDDAVSAAIAKNFLANMGIPAILGEENTVATNWMLSGIVGGIKLQVDRMQAERAEMLLLKFPPNVEESEKESANLTTAIATKDTAEEVNAEIEEKNPVNELANKAFRAAVFGLLLSPLQLYALYILISLWRTPGKLSQNYRWKVWCAILLNMPIMSVFIILFFVAESIFSSGPGSPDRPNWQRTYLYDFKVSLKFPHKPEEHFKEFNLPEGDAREYRWNARAHYTYYSLTIYQYDFRLDDIPVEARIKNVVQKLADDVKAKIQSEVAVKLGDFSGCEYRLEGPKTRERGRVFIRGQQIIEVYVNGAEQDISSEEADRFLKSLRFL